MATSAVQIANRALQKLGAHRIESLTEDSPNARSVTTAYEAVRDRLLRDYVWNFAIKRVSVPASSVKTAWGDLSRFPKPNDFVRLLRDTEAGTFFREDRKRWQVEGEFIVTSDDAPLEFRYVARIEDVSKFDSLFTELLAVSVAAELIGDIDTSDAKKQTILAERAELERRARHVNSLENDSDEPPEDDWLLSRL